MPSPAEYGLTPQETRVLGSLLEKERLTPDVYPMTLNGLAAACNQKTSREPVTDYAEAEILAALDGLRAKGLARLTSGERADKYRHLVDEVHDLDAAAQAALTVLLLRGPQTAGEVRTRAGRLFEFATVDAAEAALAALAEHGFAVKLARQPGSREQRYAHRLAGEPSAPAPGAEAAPAGERPPDRVAVLESEVAALRAEVAELREAFARFRAQFE